MRTLTAYNEDNFRQIEQYNGISVVRFSAPWCPPCQASEEMFSQFADRLDGDIQVGKVNVDGVRLENGNFPTLSVLSLTSDFVPLSANP
ncbi:Thioredoxin [Enterobacter hormaechei]|uniref:thioredoxin family protein n=1 Tax=Enterobacter hormaechei TaxID=158836 RepID=UPI0007966255|nr:thioredoxin domain-containing protein [Enterobacter hormaechei]CZW25509.1 Thioredoxin [Enterobacter hormaechei]CZY18909.1 Thioredoxin [Enterobacter hormaechei]